VKWNFLSDFRLQACLSAFCVHDVQSFTVARWTDFLPYNENSLCLCFPDSQRHSVLYVKQLTNDRRAEICARLEWQGCTGTFTMIVPDEQLHFYRLCGTSMYSNVLDTGWLCRTVPVALTGTSQLRANGISSCCCIVNVHNHPFWATSSKEGMASQVGNVQSLSLYRSG
jgi:hypothetical protein